MRKKFCDSLLNRSAQSDMVFLTGDLGFMALEPLKNALGERFINAGISEQNMVSVAAAMARENLDVWVYSIAPFCYARPFEQVRNDIAFHNLPVKLIGNGGGYAYGVMGPTHHAIEDYGVLLTLPNIHVYIPAFDADLEDTISRAGNINHPAYIRLGRSELPKGYPSPAYAPWRQILKGNGPTVIAAGPIAGTYIESFSKLPDKNRPNFWVVAELPLSHNPIPTELLKQIKQSSGLCVIEEHVQRGGVGAEIALILIKDSICVRSFHHFFARAHSYNTAGSQKFLRQKSGLNVEAVINVITQSGT